MIQKFFAKVKIIKYLCPQLFKNFYIEWKELPNSLQNTVIWKRCR